MNVILILFFLSLIAIGIAYYFDYKKDKKYFKKSILNIILLIVIIIGIILFDDLLKKCYNYILN